MNVGIIGAGGIAGNYLKVIKTLDNIQISGIYDINNDTAAELAKKTGFPLNTDSHDLIKKSDAIIITAPNFTHFDYSVEAIDNNKHVLCEKPMAADLEEGIEMTKLANNSKSICAVGFNYRYLSIARELKKLLTKKELGEILSVKLEFKKSSAISRKTYTWRDASLSRSTSGALGDLGSHLIDLMYFLFDQKIDIRTMKLKIKTNVPEKENRKVFVDDFATIYGRMTEGIYFNITASKSTLPKETGINFEIIGSKKEFYYKSSFKEKYFIKESIEYEEHTLKDKQTLQDPENEIFGWADTFRNQLTDWLEQASGDSRKRNLALFQDGLYTQYILHHLIDYFKSNNLKEIGSLITV